MKEKTFEELIEEVEYNLDNGNFVVSDTVKELLQLVREATIAECVGVVNRSNKHIDPFAGEIKITIPTDRILTDK